MASPSSRSITRPSTPWHRVPEALVSTIAAAERDPTIRAIVIMGAGRTFIAGADIKDLEQAAWNDGAGALTFMVCCRQSRIAPNPSSWRSTARRLAAA